MWPPIRRFNIIILRPHWAQYVISQGFSFLVTLVLFLVAGHESAAPRTPILMLGTIIGFHALYGCLQLSLLRYIITGEQLIVQHGVLRRTRDYIELYRIVDFCESRNIPEQLFALKTVSIFSGDRTNPRLDIHGMEEKVDVVTLIRERVEYNKQRKGIYEITNR